jgi:heterotetrameric sarcosine oxidase delta subunit
MAFEIPCPTCGPRPYTEFRFGGEARAHGEDLWSRRNKAGVQTERWYHAAGCRRWLTTRRDTRTNRLETGGGIDA